MKIFFIVYLVLISNMPSFSEGNPYVNNDDEEIKPPGFYVAGEIGIPLKVSEDGNKFLYNGSLGIYLSPEKNLSLHIELAGINPKSGYIGAGLSYTLFQTRQRTYKLSSDAISLGGLFAFYGSIKSHGGPGVTFISEIQYLHRFSILFGVTAGVKHILLDKVSNPWITMGIQLY